MQLDVGMVSQELLDRTRLVRGEVIEDDVNLAFGGLGTDDVFQKCNKFLAGMAWSGLSNPPPVSGFKAAAFCSNCFAAG